MPELRPLEVASRKRLYAAGSDGAYEVLELGTPLGIDLWDDHFMGDQMRYDATAPWAYQSTASGTGAGVAAISAGLVGGQAFLDPGSDDDGRSDISLGLHFTGSRFAVCIWRFRTGDGLGSAKFELGFTDVVSGTDAGAVNAKSTPTFNASDAALLVLDTDDDTLLTLVGVQAGTAATASDFTTALANNTFYYGVVALRGTRAAGYLLDTDGNVLERQPTSGYMENAVTAATLLTPWAFAQNRSAAQRRVYLDRLKCYQFATPSS